MSKSGTFVVCDARPMLHTAQQTVLDYAEHLARLQGSASSIHKRKSKGQIFTPGTVARFMANLLTIERNQIRLLDPGSGTGILIAAFCEHLVKQTDSFRALNGNTQVNASDMRILPLPSIEIIRKIGKCIFQNLLHIGHDLDTIVAHILELDSDVVNELNGEVWIADNPGHMIHFNGPKFLYV